VTIPRIAPGEAAASSLASSTVGARVSTLTIGRASRCTISIP
jgi:hypothetical protein